ncbi:uncharacterized protein [Amphiura filiformis]|uniref:uncharacterized protein n=1 Tax=Amphiura filiformis TaxID=82378 RepID=UPI003B224216
MVKMQKRNQDFLRGQDGYVHSDCRGVTDSPVPAKRSRMAYTAEAVESKTTISASNQNEQKFESFGKSPSTSPEISQIRKESTNRPTPRTLPESFVEKRCDTNVCNLVSKPTMSPSIPEEDDLDKRSAFREVSRSRHENTSCNNQISREHLLQQINNNKYIQPRPCNSIYTDYSYLRSSFFPMVIPPRNGSISTIPSLQEAAARWQHPGVSSAAAAHYASYYHQLSAPKPAVDLKTESERYMERLIARERAQAESYALRCAIDKSTHPLSPTFGRRLADPLSAQPPNLVTFARPEDNVDPWQRNLLSNAVFPLSSSMVELPSENWCAKCNASFRMTSDLVYHMRTHHKRNGVEDIESKRRTDEKLKCSICNETFRERHHLTRHMTSHVNG